MAVNTTNCQFLSLVEDAGGNPATPRFEVKAAAGKLNPAGWPPAAVAHHRHHPQLTATQAQE